VRGRGEQIAETAEGALADLPLVRREERRLVHLPGEDVEMVEPEVRHHFLQLPLGRDRAHHLRLRELGHEVASHAALVGHVLRQVGRAPLEHGKLRELRLERAVLDALGMELLVEERGYADARETFPILRAGAERGARQQVLVLFALEERRGDVVARAVRASHGQAGRRHDCRTHAASDEEHALDSIGEKEIPFQRRNRRRVRWRAAEASGTPNASVKPR